MFSRVPRKESSLNIISYYCYYCHYYYYYYYYWDRACKAKREGEGCEHKGRSLALIQQTQ